MCGGNNENSSRRTIVTDEYSVETTDETTVKYVPAPKPAACTCPLPPPPPPQCPQPLVCFCAPPVAKYEPPRYIPLKRCPSLTSVVTVNFPVCATEAPKTPASIRRCASIKRVDSCCNRSDDNTVVTLVNLPLNPPRPSRSRASSRSRLCVNDDDNNNKLVRSTSITYRSNENLNDLNIKYDFEETFEETKCAPKPKECTCPPKVTICTCPPPPCPKPNPCPLPVYPSICAPKQQPACTCPPKPKECTCPPKPKECTCPPKPRECTCPPKPKDCTCPCPPTKITICPCPPPPCPKPNPCPLPVYPSICNKNSSSSSSSCLSSSKSFSNLANIETTTSMSYEEAKAACAKQSACSSGNSLTYVYNDCDNDRQVTYIRHTDNDPGLSLPGCLVKVSETHLPVTRSVNLGAIFNGSSFGLLSKF